MSPTFFYNVIRDERVKEATVRLCLVIISPFTFLFIFLVLDITFHLYIHRNTSFSFFWSYLIGSILVRRYIADLWASMVLIKYQSVSKSILSFIRIVIYNRYEVLFFMDGIEELIVKVLYHDNELPSLWRL